MRLITIGGSSGGKAAILKILKNVPKSIDAAFVVVIHTSYDTPTFFDIVLQKQTELKVELATHNTVLNSGTVYIAQPNCHLIICDHTIQLSKGPRENLFRPAIDVLFRSAAVSFGNQCIGILLTGRLNDGSTGLEAIKKCGGIAIIQNPDSAEFTEMPRSAQELVDVDHVLELEDIAQTLESIVAEPPPMATAIPNYLIRENDIVKTIASRVELENDLGHQVPLSCPSCSGPLWKIERSNVDRYRCHTGHSFTKEALLEGQNTALEEALWISLRTLEEKKVLLSRMVKDYSERKMDNLSRSYEDKLQEISQHINKIRHILQLDD